MSSDTLKIENSFVLVKETRETSEVFVTSSKKLSATKHSFISMFTNSNSPPKFLRKSINSQTSDQSFVKDTCKDKLTEKPKFNNSDNSLYNSTRPSDTTKMVVSFQTGSSRTNNPFSNSITPCQASKGSISIDNTMQAVSKPAAGKVLKNGSSGNPSNKGNYH